MFIGGFMKKLFILVCLIGFSSPAWAGSLSANLGATQLGQTMDDFAACHNQQTGYHEGLIAQRLEQKLAVSGQLTPQEKDVWMANIQALKQSYATHSNFQ